MTVGGFDRRQYGLLLRLLRDLGSRRELTSQLGLDGSAVWFVSPILLVTGGLFSLIALGHPPARGFLMGALGLTTFFLLPTLISEAADAFMNPAEASVLAHRPIRGSTYTAAKLTYVLGAALLVALPLNVIPAVVGISLPNVGWFYPLTHLVAVSMTAVCVALLACGGFGVLFRLVPLTRLRAAAMWSQIIGMMVVPIAPQILRLSGRAGLTVNLDAPYLSAIPVTWFAALGLLGHGPGLRISWPYAGLGGAICLLVIAGGVGALSQSYMTRVVLLMRMRSARAGSRRPAPGWWRWPAWLPGRPASRAGAAFVAKMALRDWQFRRAFFQGPLGLIVMMGFLIARNSFKSPIAAEGIAGPIQAVPHLLGLIGVTACQFLAFSDHHRAAWIFLTAPGEVFRGFVRGMFWGLWAGLVAAPHIPLALLGIWQWGLADGLLFAAYGLSVASFYLAATVWLADGLPFTKPPRPSRAAANQGVTLVILLGAAILIGLQSFLILPSRMTTMIATGIFMAAAWVAAQTSFRVLVGRVEASLESQVSSPTRLFRKSAAE